MQEDLIRHLEMVQSVINRMSGNSFLLKGWTITVSSALLALVISNPKPLFEAIALFSVLAFWGLDAYYLRQERLYRRLYDDVRRGLVAETQEVEPFILSTARYRSQVQSWFRTLWSRSIISLHGVVVAVVIISVVLLSFSP